MGSPRYQEGLAPVTFHEDVLAAAVSPVTCDPDGAGMRRRDVVAWDPDVVVAFIAVIAGVPGPIAVLGWRGRNDFAGRSRRADTDVDLCVGDAYGEDESAGGGEEEFLHRRSFSLTTSIADASLGLKVVLWTVTDR